VTPPQIVERTAHFIELRASQDGDGRTLEGYAAVFDTPTRIDSWEGQFDETIARGAFKKTLREKTPVLQFDHGHDARTGSVPIGSIEQIREDAKGLFVRARLFDNPVVEPIRQAIEGGAIDGMSFRFRVLRDEWEEPSDKDRQKGKIPQRTIREVQLFELGPVVFPAYPTTSVGVRDDGATTIAGPGWQMTGGPALRFDQDTHTFYASSGTVPPGTPFHSGTWTSTTGITATSDDAARTSDTSDAADTSDDAGSPDPKRVALSALRLRALQIRGVTP
jgi:HK97 family phage prohead protease